ncbi:MAG TPA: hypothetical protein VN764_15615, partial [Polyangiaceae bacterium]|nr:hypothetical protein [Polyangiaceae bacterium]
MVKLNLKDLLKRALMVDAVEVRLVPGRRTIVITAAGENEVRGDTQTPERINAMLEPVLTGDARRALNSGWASWSFDLPGHGVVEATAELKMGLVHAHFDLSKKGGAMIPPTTSEPGPVVQTIHSPAPVVAQAVAAPVVVPSAEFHPPAVTYNPTQVSMKQVRVESQSPPPSPKVGHGPTGSTEAIDVLLRKMVEMGASDLHISVGSPPILRL